MTVVGRDYEVNWHSGQLDVQRGGRPRVKVKLRYGAENR